jgi:small subunit ribosomal protein S6e
MAVFKFVINDTKNKRSCQIEVDQSKAAGLVGKRIGEEFNGDILDLTGYVLEITGGTDKDGFPMYPGLKGMGRKKMLLSGKPGFKPSQKGQRKRKTVRGDTISESIVQINAKIIKVGEKPLDQIITKKTKAEAPKEEKASEETKAEKPEAKKEKAETKKEKKEKPKKEEKPAEKQREAKEEPKKEVKEEQKQPKETPAENKETTGGVESKDKN